MNKKERRDAKRAGKGVDELAWDIPYKQWAATNQLVSTLGLGAVAVGAFIAFVTYSGYFKTLTENTIISAVSLLVFLGTTYLTIQHYREYLNHVHDIRDDNTMYKGLMNWKNP